MTEENMGDIKGEISFCDVSFSFGEKTIIKHFSDHVCGGEHVGIMGPSGAGKSTLLNSIIGLSVPTAGDVKVSGLAVTPENIQMIREHISWVPQNVELPYQTVDEMLRAPYELAVNKGKRFDRRTCIQYLERLGLDEFILEKSLTALSGGEKQRLLIISALMLGRQILLLDEPTSALDPNNSERLNVLLRALSETTILSVTHDEKFAASMDRIINLKSR